MTAHLLPHMAALFAGDLTVLVRIGHVEVMQRDSLRFLQGHAPVLVGVRRGKHVSAETAAVRATLLETVGAFANPLLAKLVPRVELGASDGAVSVAVQTREHLLAALGTLRGGRLSLAAGGTARVQLCTGHLAVAIRVEASKALRRIATFGAVGTLRGALTALGVKHLHFRLGDCTVTVGIDAGEVLLHLGYDGRASLHLMGGVRGCLCNGDARENGSSDAAK